MNKLSYRRLIFILIIFVPGFSWAVACTTSSPYQRVMVSGPAKITVDPSVPNGSVIGTMTGTFPRSTYPCLYPDSPGALNANGTGVPDGNLYPTSMQGVAYRIKMTGGWSVAGFYNTYWPISGAGYSPNWSLTGDYMGGTFSVELVKTGPVYFSDSWTPGILGTIDQVIKNVTYTFLEFYSGTPIPIVPSTPACTVTQSTIAVVLNPVSAAKFKAAGDTYEDTSFNIPLNCKVKANVSLSFSGESAGSNNGVFKSSNAATANTIGIQLLDKNGSPVSTALNTATTVGAVNGKVNYSMTARYYALASNVSTGDVNTIVYATIIYN